MADTTRFPDEDELEQLIDENEPAYSIYWDSGAPGAGAETERIYRWGEGYIALLSYDVVETVFPTLRAALDATEIHGVSSATKRVNSSELSSEELVDVLEPRLQRDDEVELVVNGERWRVTKEGRFERVK